MKKIVLTTLLALTTSAYADCYLRSITVNEMKARIQRKSDAQREVVFLGNGMARCTVTFRVQINNAWYTAQGRADGDVKLGEAQLCAQAEDGSRARILQDVGGMETSVSQEMVCTDQELPKWKPVKKGDTVRESEVAPDPDYRESFAYRGMECRRFLETVTYGVGGLVQNKGVICRIRNDEWFVFDKWERVRG